MVSTEVGLWTAVYRMEGRLKRGGTGRGMSRGLGRMLCCVSHAGERSVTATDRHVLALAAQPPLLAGRLSLPSSFKD